MGSLSRSLWGICLVVLLVFPARTQSYIFPEDDSAKPGGGNACMICTLIVSALDNAATLNSQEIDEYLEEFCNWLPSELQISCTFLVEMYGTTVIEMLEKDESPSAVCQAIEFCTPGTCDLFNGTSAMPSIISKKSQHVVKQDYPWDWLMKELDVVFDSHLPLLDVDNDTFSTIETLRGSNWRGRDCDDGSRHIYPGRKVLESGLSDDVDYNCNGISGTVPGSSQTYEELLCEGTGQMGIAVIGGSACAHFEISPKWVVAKLMNESSYDDLLTGFENELDWPHRSWATGYLNSTAEMPVSSLYLHMRERNLCNHRDYQNIGLNGASSNTIVETMHTLSRDQVNDQPLLLVYNPLGDDVCNMDVQNTSARMTTVPKFKENVLTAMSYFDTILPPGSHVLFIGLVDGRILWNGLHDKPHPVFQPTFNATYAEVYEWLLCLEANPCVGWMNPDEEIRNFTSERAAALSEQYAEIVANYTFKNFDMVYYPFPLQEIVDAYVKTGKPITDLIEPVDGFHPSQILNALLGDYYYNLLLQEHPDFLGDENPNNAKIAQLFDSQGGY